MFEQLDQQGRLVLHEAERVAHRLAHHYIGTEHLLVGLALVEGDANRALAVCGLSPTGLEREVAELLGRGRAPIVVRPPLTSTAELVLERARWLARQRGCTRAADVDLLLAVVQLADSTAATVLRRLGVDPAVVEKQLGRVGRSGPGGPVPAPLAGDAGHADNAGHAGGGAVVHVGGVDVGGVGVASSNANSDRGVADLADRPGVDQGPGGRGATGSGSPPAPGRAPGPTSMDTLAEDLIALRREVIRLRAEVARLSLLVEGH